MRSSRQSRGGFTLFETMMVVTLMAVLAITAVPAVSTVRDARLWSAGIGVVTSLEEARAMALATGSPHGVEFDPVADTTRKIWIESAGDPPAPAPTPAGGTSQIISIPALYPGSGLDSVTHGDASAGAGVVWFGFSGIPETRQAGGTLVGPYSQNAVVVMPGGVRIEIDAGTGRVGGP